LQWITPTRWISRTCRCRARPTPCTRTPTVRSPTSANGSTTTSPRFTVCDYHTQDRSIFLSFFLSFVLSVYVYMYLYSVSDKHKWQYHYLSTLYGMRDSILFIIYLSFFLSFCLCFCLSIVPLPLHAVRCARLYPPQDLSIFLSFYLSMYLCIYIYILYVCMYVCLEPQASDVHICSLFGYAYVRVGIHGYIYIYYIHLFIYLFICIYICIYVYTHALQYLFITIYVCINI